MYYLNRTLIFLTLLSISVLAFSNARGPKNKRTGAPGESICVASDCHIDYEVNSGPGTLTLTGIPETYTPGNTYPITIQLQQKGQQRWGFQVTVINDQGIRSGEIVKFDDGSMQLETDDVEGKERFYLKHTRRGTHQGEQDGPVQWQFVWKAPESGEGVISFYAAGNAANGNRKPTGDYIYTTVQKSDLGSGQ